MKEGRLLWGKPADGGDLDALWGIDAAPHVLIKVKRIFPRANQERSGRVILADTPEVARDIEWLRGRYDLQAEPDVLERLERRANEHRARETAVAEILSGQRRLDDRYRAVGEGREHRDYQYEAADLVLATGRLLLVDELGLGKSMSGLLVLREPEALPALIVCLTHLPAQWEGEVRETFPDLRVHVVKTLEPYDPAKRRGSGGVDPDVSPPRFSTAAKEKRLVRWTTAVSSSTLDGYLTSPKEGTSPMSGYSEQIKKAAPASDPRHVEAYMRLEYGTLDHLDADSFRREARIAAECVRQDPDTAEALAVSYGL